MSREKRASAAAEVGPDGGDGGRHRIGASASEWGDTGKAMGKRVELPVVDGDASRATSAAAYSLPSSRSRIESRGNHQRWRQDWTGRRSLVAIPANRRPAKVYAAQVELREPLYFLLGHEEAVRESAARPGFRGQIESRIEEHLQRRLWNTALFTTAERDERCEGVPPALSPPPTPDSGPGRRRVRRRARAPIGRRRRSASSRGRRPCVQVRAGSPPTTHVLPRPCRSFGTDRREIRGRPRQNHRRGRRRVAGRPSQRPVGSAASAGGCWDRGSMKSVVRTSTWVPIAMCELRIRARAIPTSSEAPQTAKCR